MKVLSNGRFRCSPRFIRLGLSAFNTPVAVFVAVIVTRDESAGLYTPECDIGNRSDIGKGYVTG